MIWVIYFDSFLWINYWSIKQNEIQCFYFNEQKWKFKKCWKVHSGTLTCIQVAYNWNIFSILHQNKKFFCPICLLYAYKMYHESWKWLKFNGKRFIWTISWILWLLISTFYFNKLWCLFFVKKLFKKVKRLCLSNLKHLNNNLLLINSVDL